MFFPLIFLVNASAPAEDLVSELTFKYDVLHRIINFDETHHGKDSEGDRGGSRTTSLTNPHLPRPGGRYAKDPGNHVSGCYGATPLEPMPPCIVYPTTAKTEERMKGKPKWAADLPAAVGRWGLGDVYEMDAHVAVRPKGSYEEDLFIRTVIFHKTLYLDLAPRFEMDGDKVVKRPVFAKCDSGPGRNCKSPRAIKFRRNMYREGFYIGPSLPNATSMSQELDNLFQQFKGDTDTKAEEIFARKTRERAKIIESMTKEEEAKVPPAYLTNEDIPEIINGRKDDPPGSSRPFDDNFTEEKTFKSFLAIGFCPFTRVNDWTPRPPPLTKINSGQP